MLFFVISGFLITWLLLKESDQHGSISIRNFYVRRALRIFPAFYCFAAFLIVLLGAAEIPIYPGHTLSSLFYVSNYYYPFAVMTVDQLDHTWSLAVEEQFYLLWPMTFVPFQRNLSRLTHLVLGVIVVVCAYRATLAFAGVSERYLYRAFDTRADHLLVGCLLAVTLKRGVGMRFWQFISRPWWTLVTLALLETSFQFDFRNTHASFLYRFSMGHLVEPWLFAALIVQTVMCWDRLLDRAPIRYIGRISYGMYLHDQIAVSLAGRMVPGGPGLSLTVVAVAATIGLAVISYKFVEQPFLRLKPRFERAPAARSSGVAPRLMTLSQHARQAP